MSTEDDRPAQLAQVDQLVAALSEPVVKQRVSVLLQAALDYVNALCERGVPIDDAMASATGAMTSSFVQVLLQAGAQQSGD